MSELVAAFQLLAVGAAAVFSATAPWLVMAKRKKFPVLPVALGIAAALLFLVWVILTGASGERADEQGTAGSIVSDVGWLAAAASVALIAVVVAANQTRPSP